MMKKLGGGFGIVILIVVVAIVLLLTAEAWKSVMPTARQIVDPKDPLERDLVVPDHGQEEAAEAVRSSDLPNLDDMRRNTSAHARQVQEALEQVDGDSDSDDGE
jgi:hypothetical protein